MGLLPLGPLGTFLLDPAYLYFWQSPTGICHKHDSYPADIDSADLAAYLPLFRRRLRRG